MVVGFELEGIGPTVGIEGGLDGEIVSRETFFASSLPLRCATLNDIWSAATTPACASPANL